MINNNIIKICFILIMTLLCGCGTMNSIESCLNSNIALECENVGKYYLDREDNDPRDIERAAQYYERACNIRGMQKCMVAANLYQKAGKLYRNKFQAKAMYKKACELGSKEGCDLYQFTVTEIKKAKKALEPFLSCMRKIDACKSQCLDGYNPFVRGNVLDVAQYHLQASECVEKCKQLQCFEK